MVGISVLLTVSQVSFDQLTKLFEGRTQMVVGNGTVWAEITKVEMRPGKISERDRFPRLEYAVRVSIVDRDWAGKYGWDPELYKKLLHILGVEPPESAE